MEDKVETTEEPAVEEKKETEQETAPAPVTEEVPHVNGIAEPEPEVKPEVKEEISIETQIASVKAEQIEVSQETVQAIEQVGC